MKLHFIKYQGAGNDFVIIDNRKNRFNPSDFKLVNQLCDRKFGIGADGLMLIQEIKGYDFEMIYYNSDGYKSTMCGNGGRCIVACANSLGIINKNTTFCAADGKHEAIVIDDSYIQLKMSNVPEIEIGSDYFYLNTGSPHYVLFVNDLNSINVFEEGRKIRYNERFSSIGTNVNFVEVKEDFLYIRTYERGVEDETLACGTGITASALSAKLHLQTDKNEFNVKAKGGELKVRFEKSGDLFQNIWLEGPAVKVFEGTISI